MNEPSTPAATAFLAKNPTYIGTVRSVDYYEHPERGDEAPLCAITIDGRVRKTEFWELPSEDEASY